MTSSAPPPTPSIDPFASFAARELFAARTVLIFGDITTELAARVTQQLLALASLSQAPIRVHLHSPGGHVESGDTMFDTIRFIKPEVTVIATGWVASAGALIYSAVPRPQRWALPNTRFLLHEPSGGVGGSASDIQIEVDQVLAMRARLNRIFAEATGHTPERIAADTGRNHWMNAEQAREYGLVGKIVVRDGNNEQ